MIKLSDELVKHWEWVPHHEVADINPRKPDLSDSTAVSFISMSAVGEENGVVDLSENRTFSKVKKGYTSFKDGDILFAKITPCMENGKVALAQNLNNGYGFGSTEFHVSRLHHELYKPFYLYYFLSRRFRKEAQRNMSGSAGQLRVPTEYFKNVIVPVPPKIEQRRIVAKIEELFSELDKGVESLKTARAQLKTYRDSIVETALSMNAKKGNLQPLGALIGKIDQGWSPKCELNRVPEDGEWAVIKTSAIQPMKYHENEAKPLPKNFSPRPEIEVKPGDILMTRKGPRKRTGVTCLVRSTRSRSMLCDTVYRFRCDEEKIDPEYLQIVLSSPRSIMEIDKRKSGISDSGISLNQKKVKELPVRVIGDLTRQREVVSEIRKNLESADALDVQIEASLERTNNLYQAILKRAFEGRLVVQDSNEESASVLLERIRQEQTNTPKPKRRKCKTGATV